jgi:hypothetical protein
LKRIVVTGGSGFVGRHLVRTLLDRGDEVVVFTRDAARRVLPPGARAVQYSPDQDGAWQSELEGKDALVNLAGEQVVGVRWTAQTKQRITQSRVDVTARLVDALGRLSARPSVLVSGSGVGYYGPCAPDVPLDESSPPGNDFLAELTQAWEARARAAEAYGIRVVRTRLGIVFGRGGGALQEMAKPFRLFAGGPIGSGNQVVSWIHIEDAVAAILWCIDEAIISGPVNVTSTDPVTNAELARALGTTLGRPSWLSVPAAAMRLRFGEGAEPLLTGQRAVPAVLEQMGFRWRYPVVMSALQQVFGTR